MCYDYVIVGSGFGGSVSAMRLTEKGYRVLVLERGKRFRDRGLRPKTNWNIWQISVAAGAALLRHPADQPVPRRDGAARQRRGRRQPGLRQRADGSPSDKLFAAPAWQHLADWKAVLPPHYDTAQRMLGVAPNPRLWPADDVLREIAERAGPRGDLPARPRSASSSASRASSVPDPYFGGEGPARRGCTHCGGCMVGCRHNAKNTLVKNYLYFAEKWGAEVRAEAEVRDIRPLPPGQPDGARYEVVYRRSTAWHSVQPRRRPCAPATWSSPAGTVGTLRLLFRCRDITALAAAHLAPRWATWCAPTARRCSA